MSCKILLENMTNTWLGIQCDHCFGCLTDPLGALIHQQRIDENNGRCPDAEKQAIPEEEEERAEG